MVENQLPKPNNDAAVASTESNEDTELIPFAEKHLKNVIDMEKIAKAIIPKAMKLTRIEQRISDEKQILDDLVRLLENFNKNLKVMPFGSATYGFGGCDTNFNICLVNDGNKNFHASNSFHRILFFIMFIVETLQAAQIKVTWTEFSKNSFHFSKHRLLERCSDFFVIFTPIESNESGSTHLILQLN